MSLYAIGDLHLCLGAYKPMDVFGGRWEGYMEKLREGLSVIAPGDTTVLLGDLSWADMFILNNNCYFYGETALCGTRGWFYEQEQEGTHDEKIFRRELGRLEASLKAAGDHEKLCFLHYPPRYRGYECPEILGLLARYGVRQCFYGHLHAESMRLAIQGSFGGCEFRLLSADYVNFKPQKLLD